MGPESVFFLVGMRYLDLDDCCDSRYSIPDPVGELNGWTWLDAWKDEAGVIGSDA